MIQGIPKRNAEQLYWDTYPVTYHSPFHYLKNRTEQLFGRTLTDVSTPPALRLLEGYLCCDLDTEIALESKHLSIP